jgi:hemoglobin
MTLHPSFSWRAQAASLLLCPLLLLAPAAQAQIPLDAPTLQAFGERTGLGALATDFVARLAQDPRTAPFFAKANAPELATKLADQFCVVLGGPCQYQGADMKTAHDGMEIRKSDFNALVEVLQQSMDARSVPFTAQNRLLARLAPMHRAIIETP